MHHGERTAMKDAVSPEERASSLDSLGIYLQQIRAIPLLSSEEERALAMDILEKRRAFRESVLTSYYGAQHALGILSELQDGSRALDRTLDIRPFDHRGKQIEDEQEHSERLRRRLPMNLTTLNTLLAPLTYQRKKKEKIYALLEETPIRTTILAEIPDKIAGILQKAEETQSTTDLCTTTLSSPACLQKELSTMESAAGSFIEKKQELACHNLRLVVSIARHYDAGPSLSLSDLIQEGNTGLMEAVQRFEPRLGYKFGTYATWWVHKFIKSALENNRYIVHVTQRAHRKVSVAEKTFSREKNAIPTANDLDKIPTLMDIEPRAAHAAMQQHTNIDSIITTKDGEQFPLRECIPAREEADFLMTEKERFHLKEEMDRALQTLDPRHAKMIQLKYLEGKTYKEISAIHNATLSSVRHMLKNCLAQLKNHTSHRLSKYLPEVP